MTRLKVVAPRISRTSGNQYKHSFEMGLVKHTEESDQRPSSLEELLSVDGITIGGVNGDIYEGLALDLCEPIGVRRSSHDCDDIRKN